MIHKYIQIGFFIQEQAIGFQNNIVHLFVGTDSTPVNGSFNRDVFMLSRKSTILMMRDLPVREAPEGYSVMSRYCY